MFPAGAGMNRTLKYVMSICSYVPRRRGDEPRLIFTVKFWRRCSPQARG